MEDAFAVQVLQPASNIEGQTDPDGPRQVEVAVQQLLQIPSVDVLQTDGEALSFLVPRGRFPFSYETNGCLCLGLTSVRAWS